MPSVLAIVSKSVFEKACRDAKPGAVFETGTYASEHRALDGLADGGTLFLVTVRPPDEALWLVAVLEKPKKGAGGWSAPANRAPIRDVTALKGSFRFANGSGLNAKKGALAMSLQTPRALADSDVALLRGGAPSPAVAPTPPTPIAKAPTAKPTTALPPSLSFDAEARRYLRPRTREELDSDVVAARKQRRARAEARMAELGGLEGAVASFAEGTLSDRELAEALGELLVFQDDDVRARCMAVADKAWAGANVARRGTLLRIFPERTDWAAELAIASRASPADQRDLLFASLADGELIIDLVKRQGITSSIVNYARTSGEGSVAALAQVLDLARYPNEEKAAARALACVGTKAAADVLVAHLRQKNVRPYATAFFAAFPRLAQEALRPLAAKKTQVGQIARDVLERVGRAEQATAAPSAASDEARGEEIPLILREPPWKRPPTKRSPRSVSARLRPHDFTSRLHWSARARRVAVAERYSKCSARDDAVEHESTYLEATCTKELALRALALPKTKLATDACRNLLARFGEDLLAPLLARSVTWPTDLLLRIEAPALAAVVTRRMSLKYVREGASEWLARFPKAAAIGLVPLATYSSDERESAESGLRLLAALGHRDEVERVAESYGKEARAAVDEMLAHDDFEDLLRKPPKMPPSYRPAELRVPTTKDGRPLPREAVEALDALLRVSLLGYPHPGLAEARAACDARSLAEHAWDLARAWDIDGAKNSQIWMLHAVAHLADDEVVRRLTPALKGEGISAMLGYIGTDAALMELVTIIANVRRTKKRPKFAYGAEAAFERIAARRGTDVLALEDAFVSTCDVDEEGGITLDLGAKHVRVTFDSRLTRILTDERGERITTLPRDGDAKVLAAAATRLRDLDEDVGSIAAMRSVSLERAMVMGLTWDRATFDAVWAKHPLMSTMARGVVWEARARRGGERVAFRVAEDGSFADVSDAPLALADDALVAVAHPARLDPAARARWSSVLADYRIMQPFEQLARAVPSMPAQMTKPIKSTAENLEKLEPTGWAWDRSTFALACEKGFGLLVVGSNEVTARASVDGDPIPFEEADVVVRAETLRALELVV